MSKTRRVPEHARAIRRLVHHALEVVAITSGCHDHADLPTDQFSCHGRDPIDLVLRPAVFDRDILALDEPFGL